MPEFEALFKTHYAELCGYANKYLDDLDAAEEVVQSLFVRLWEKRKDLDIKSSLKSYLFSSVRNACFNEIKHVKIKEEYKAHYQRVIEEDQVFADEEYEASELENKIRSSIEKLPEGRQKIFILSRYEGLKYQEIADKLGVSIKTVENQMGAAMKFLRSELAEYLVTVAWMILFWRQ